MSAIAQWTDFIDGVPLPLVRLIIEEEFALYCFRSLFDSRFRGEKSSRLFFYCITCNFDTPRAFLTNVDPNIHGFVFVLVVVIIMMIEQIALQQH